MTKEVCEGCGQLVDELCRDGYCRKCHVAISFENCINNTWLEEWRANHPFKQYF